MRKQVWATKEYTLFSNSCNIIEEHDQMAINNILAFNKTLTVVKGGGQSNMKINFINVKTIGVEWTYVF